MSKVLICFVVVGLQLFIFSDYISIFSWGEIKVKGLACTCPDEKVLSGVIYLKSITPDSLKKYNIDYSEIYVTEKPSIGADYMGVDEYFIKGKVIGKKRVYKGSYYWNLFFKVESWRKVDPITSILVNLLFYSQFILMPLIIYLTAKKQNYNR